jgi:hypothetical protein
MIWADSSNHLIARVFSLDGLLLIFAALELDDVIRQLRFG